MPFNRNEEGSGHANVAFVIPVKNEAKRLPRCLNAIKRAANQARIIVVDNGSTDESCRIAASFGAMVFHNPCGTIAKSRNIGARNTDEEYIVFIDADVEIDGDFVRLGLACFKRDENIGIVTGYIGIPEDSAWVARIWALGRLAEHNKVDLQWSSSMNMIIKRDVFFKAGQFSESMVTFEDVEFCMRVRRLGCRIVYDGDVRITHHGEAQNLRALFLKEYWRGLGSCEFLTQRLIPLKNRLRPCQHALPILAVIAALLFFSSQRPLWGMILLFTGLFLLPAVRAVLGIWRSSAFRQAPRLFLVWFFYHCARSSALAMSCLYRISGRTRGCVSR